MLAKQKQTNFMLKSEEFDLYKQVTAEYRSVSLLIYAPFRDSELIKAINMELFFLLYKPDENLYIDFSLAIMHPFKAEITRRVQELKSFKYHKMRVEGHAAKSYLCAIQLTNCVCEMLLQFREQEPEIFAYIETFRNKDIEKLFAEHFQSIADYPKDYAVAQARLVQFTVAHFKSAEQDANGLFESAMREGSAIFEVLKE